VRILAGHAGGAAGQRATLGEVFGVAEFRALFAASLLSVTGDQLARVAITLLVYDRTRSPLLAAVTFATSIVPMFVGGVALSGLADRLPRRQVMIVTDVASGVLVALMAVPGVPLAVLLVLLFAVTMLSAPYLAARSGILPDVLTGDRYAAGLAVMLTSTQLAQVAGSAAGGAVAGFIGARACLVADAMSFAVSALLTWARVRKRPVARLAAAGPPAPGSDGAAASGPAGQARRGMLGEAGAGLRLALGSSGLRTPLLLAWLAVFYAVPEGVAAPLARSAGGGAVTAGLILAAVALGATSGFMGLSRLVDPPQRIRLMRPLAVAGCAVLMLFAVHPPVGGMLVILTVCGVLACYQLPCNVLMVQNTPPSWRSQMSGIVNGGMALGQGAGMIVAGAAAERFSVPAVIAGSGLLGTLCALAIVLSAAPAAGKAHRARGRHRRPAPGSVHARPGAGFRADLTDRSAR
jgi:predicted MFS family arabinose efflux permease